MKKIISVILALAMIVTVFAVTATVASAATETTYILVYAGNGGLGSVVGNMVYNLVDGQTVVVKENNYACNDATMEFSHWNTAADNSGTSYNPGDNFTINAADANSAKRVVLYAIWEKVPGVYVTYNKNTTDPACLGEINDTTEYPKGSEVKALGINSGTNTYTYPLHKFVEWNTKADGTGTGYQPGDAFTITDHTTLYAIWENSEKEVTFYGVTFDANGGEGEMTPETNIPAGGSIMAPDCEFTKEGYVFNGWNTKADGSGDTYEMFDDVPVNTDLVLYAMWTDEEAWMYDPDDGESANIAIAVALSTLALGALFVVAKKEIED